MPKRKRQRDDSNAPLRVGQHIQVYHHSLSRWQRGWFVVSRASGELVVVHNEAGKITCVPREYVRPAFGRLASPGTRKSSTCR
jgi:hypothetical protein